MTRCRRAPVMWMIVAAITLCTSAAKAQPADRGEEDRRASPFEALRWDGLGPVVMVGGIWYRPVSIDGVPVAAVLAFCEQRWPGLSRKRFGEDLVEAMNLMDAPIGETVVLELTPLDGGEQLRIEGVGVTGANRRAIWETSRPANDAPRDHPATISREQAVKDLEELHHALETRFAYLHLRNTDWSRGLEEIKAGLPEVVSVRELAEKVRALMAVFGDGHASVVSPHDVRPRRFPPVLFVSEGDEIVAVKPDRAGLIDERFPYVVAIDGVPIAAWIAAAAESIPAGSEQLVRERTARALRDVELLRARLGIAADDAVRLTLEERRGAGERRRADVTLEMTGRRPTYGAWPDSTSRMLPGNVGYLRIPRMDDGLIPELHARMAEFRETRGLVVDVRGNGGGSRGLLVALAGYLTGPGEGPWVGSVAQYLRAADFEQDHLEARSMYRASDPRWGAAERAAIEACAASFKPEWQEPPGRGWSEWHYLVLGQTGVAEEYFYDRPVVILSDAACFSATDIFLGALQGRPRITLMGQASGGGSARAQAFKLGHSRLEVRCASMASFRPDGRLYDGRGVDVDIAVEPGLRDSIRGGGDRVLDAALAQIEAAAEGSK